MLPRPEDKALERQVKAELAAIKAEIAAQDFKISGLEFSYIVINRKRVSVTKTVAEAYYEMQDYLKHHPQADPVRALAIYHAHFKVAMIHDHDSRHETTRAFYQQLAEKTGADIFPTNEAAAKKFDKEVKRIEAIIARKRAPEQTEYLEFLQQIETEKNNIQTLKNNLTNFSAIIEKSCGELTELDSVGKQIDPELLEINAAAREKILKDVQFLNRTIEAMQKAESRTDLMKYATDAQIVLDCILVYMAKTGIKNQTEQQLEAEIPQLKGNIQAYANHHREIMTSLQDKKNALYLSSALEAAAAVSVAPIAHIGGGDFAAKLASASITVGAAPGIVTGIEVGSQKLGLGLQAVMNETPEVTGLANVRLPSKNYSVSDLYTFTAAQIKKSATDPESIIQYQKTALLTGLALLVPALAIPIAVAITGERVGKIAYRAHSHNQLFKKAEIKALDRMAKHETEMQAYLRDHPNHRRYEERRQNWESKQLGAKASDEKAVRPKLK